MTPQEVRAAVALVERSLKVGTIIEVDVCDILGDEESEETYRVTEKWCVEHAHYDGDLGWMFVVSDYDSGLSPQFDRAEMERAGCSADFIDIFQQALALRPTYICLSAVD